MKTKTVATHASALIAGVIGMAVLSPDQEESPEIPPVRLMATTPIPILVTIAWDPNPEPNLTGYELYAFDEDGQETLVKETDKDTTKTTLLVSQSYDFRVKAIANVGIESPFSGILKVEVQRTLDLKDWETPDQAFFRVKSTSG